jgi:phospholipid/cholesterol/gamma-HCH transport system substrate-binding protein
VDHRIPRIGLVLAIVCTALAVVTFIALNEAFEGPSVTSGIGGDPYELEATFTDTEALPTKQPVLVRGVQVGKVTAVEYNEAGGDATVTFTVDDEVGPVHGDATVRIGERTLLGDAFLDLDPGTDREPELEAGASVKAVPSVDFDEAFDFLDERGRRHVDSIITTLDEATGDEEAGPRVNATLGSLERTTAELRDLTDALRGQEAQIAGFVGDTSTVLGVLGEREEALRRIVGSGRAALAALAGNTASLEQGAAELPGVLAAGTEALRVAEPLLRDARPLVAEVREAAPDLAPALADVGPLAADTVRTVKDVSGLPSLRKLLRVVILGGPAVPGLEASVRNLVPLLRYAAPRSRGIVSFFSNFAGLTAHGDSDGAWARFAIMFDPGEVADLPLPSTCLPEDDVPVNAGLCHNAYPEPGDASDPEPYEPGSYPRLRPYDPPPPQDD